MASGMVIRAFVHHSNYKNSQEIHKAGYLLESRLFKEDVYTSRSSVDY